MAYPKVPPIFMKPATALIGPGDVEIPKISQIDDCADYEAELGVVIGKACKNVSESAAMDSDTLPAMMSLLAPLKCKVAAGSGHSASRSMVLVQLDHVSCRRNWYLIQRS